MSSHSRPLSFTPRARKDFTRIIQYTEQKWGVTQADTYDEELNSVLELIRQSPEMSRERPELFLSCRSRPAGQHIVYFRIGRDAIVIHRILHHKQDPLGKVRNPQR
jgi:toxin ParE1/3/4